MIQISYYRSGQIQQVGGISKLCDLCYWLLAGIGDVIKAVGDFPKLINESVLGDAVAGFANIAAEAGISKLALEGGTELFGEAIPMLGAMIGIHRIGSGSVSAAKGTLKGSTGFVIKGAGKVTNNEKWKCKGNALKTKGGWQVTEGVCTAKAGVLVIAGQAPGMVFVTLPASIALKQAASKAREKRKGTRDSTEAKQEHGWTYRYVGKKCC